MALTVLLPECFTARSALPRTHLCTVLPYCSLERHHHRHACIRQTHVLPDNAVLHNIGRVLWWQCCFAERKSRCLTGTTAASARRVPIAQTCRYQQLLCLSARPSMHRPISDSRDKRNSSMRTPQRLAACSAVLQPPTSITVTTWSLIHSTSTDKE
jgi:hypothetical protein